MADLESLVKAMRGSSQPSTPSYGGTIDPFQSGAGGGAENLLYLLPGLGYLGAAGKIARAAPEAASMAGQLASEGRGLAVGGDMASRGYNLLPSFQNFNGFKSSSDRDEAHFEAKRQANRERYASDPQGFMGEVSQMTSGEPRSGPDRLAREFYLRSLPPEVLDQIMPQDHGNKPFMMGR